MSSAISITTLIQRKERFDSELSRLQGEYNALKAQAANTTDPKITQALAKLQSSLGVMAKAAEENQTIINNARAAALKNQQALIKQNSYSAQYQNADAGLKDIAAKKAALMAKYLAMKTAGQALPTNSNTAVKA